MKSAHLPHYAVTFAVAAGAICANASAAAPGEAPVAASAQLTTQTVHLPGMNVSDTVWKQSIARLEAKGVLQPIQSNSPTQQYRIFDPVTRAGIGSVAVAAQPARSDAPTPYISGGMLHWYEPAVIFNQSDQNKLKHAGAAAVTGMAAAWAAALSETVVGGVLSAGAIAGIGYLADSYINKHGICPGHKNLWVGVAHDIACK